MSTDAEEVPRRARAFAVQAHGYQRYGTRPYVEHLDAVADLVRDLGEPFETIAYLHDVLEDTDIERPAIEGAFGAQVSRAVALLSDPGGLTRAERKAVINARLAEVGPGDATWPALVVKVADRLANVRACVRDGNDALRDRYAREHEDFRAAAWRPGVATWMDELDRLLEHTPRDADPTGPMDPVADEFVASFRKHWSAYRAEAAALAMEVERLLARQGIQGVVTHRAKAPERLAAKLSARATERGQPYGDARAIREDLADLIGVRVALYFPDDRERVASALARAFDIVERRDHLGNQERHGSRAPRFSGYWAQHFRVARSVSRHAIIAEIQVASVLMTAWSQVAHDLTYKPLNGGLSDTEEALLDQLNGLVLAGETALEQLHAAMRARLRRTDAPFANPYELSAWLARTRRKASRSADNLGRVDRLFALLRELNLLRPSALHGFMPHLDETGPVAERLVERILIAHPARTRAWVESLGTSHPLEQDFAASDLHRDAMRALGEAWRAFERGAATQLTGGPRSPFPVGPKRLAALALLPEQEAQYLKARRTYRAALRQPASVEVSQMRAATEDLEGLSRQLRAAEEE